MIFLLADNLQDFGEVDNQASVLTLCDEPKSDLLERLGGLGVELSSIRIFLLLEELVGVDSRHVGLLAALAVL